MALDPRIPVVTDIIGVRTTVYENPRLLASERLRGCCLHSQGRIELDPLLCPDQQCETYLHEVMHAIAHAVEVKMEEDEVSRLARGLFQVLRANKLGFADIPEMNMAIMSSIAPIPVSVNGGYRKAEQE